MTNECINTAANWWVKKILVSNNKHVYGITEFFTLLKKEIKRISCDQASIVISTIDNHVCMLDEIAFYSGLTSDIPHGYEMRILVDTIFIYDAEGKLVEKL